MLLSRYPLFRLGLCLPKRLWVELWNALRLTLTTTQTMVGTDFMDSAPLIRAGQAYTAFSRVKSLEFIEVVNFAYNKVRDYYFAMIHKHFL